jgi:hypothetical protein
MKSAMSWILICVATLAVQGAAFAQAGTCAGMSLGPGANLNGFIPFPADNLWNTNIASMPVDPNSANIINFIGSTVTLHPDFGAGLYSGSTIGIPYQVEAGTQAKVIVKLGLYASESDPGPMPIPNSALIEGYPHVPPGSDAHVLVLEKDGCWLYELYQGARTSGEWTANSTAIWDMTTDEQRPYTWTSADAAGLPIFVGLARYDEVAAGAINHALRFTVPVTQEAFVAPASHWASTITNPDAPPMGTRLRLKASFDISGFSASNQVILKALQQYGMILADNGSAIYISGAPDNRWNNNDLNQLKTLTGSDFDVVQLGTIITPANVPTGPSPLISSFTANPATVTAGMPSTLSWATSGGLYTIVTPSVGPTRTTSATVTPTKTTKYMLIVTNQYGRKTKSVTVTVQ